MASMQSQGVRLIDVAHAANVSIASASRALTGAGGVSADVAERVRAIAADLGYVANVHARSLASGASSSIGLVVHEVADPYFSEIASGVLGVATTRGLSVQMVHSGRDPGTELRQIRALLAHRVGALIIAGSGFVDPAAEEPIRAEVQRFTDGGGRAAVIGRHSLRVDAVLPDNGEGARAVAEHLLALGHRRIAVIVGSRTLTTVADRLAGVAEALTTTPLRLDVDVPVVEAPFTREGGKQATRRVLADHPGVTAVLALNDDMAIGALSVLRQEGVRVPEQMSVTGFDDVPVAGDLAPGLTTIRLPMTRMGAQALDLALRPAAARPRRVRMRAELVVRDSTAAPAAH